MFFVKPEATAERQKFGQRLNQNGMAPLWDVLGDIVTAEPRPSCTPAIWRYSEVRPLLMESGELITAKEAERRVLILENPGTPGRSRITESLYAGLQLVLPGETAPAHRHVAAALRFVLESNGGYTAVDGERVTMWPGDLILTPSWTWHDHGNPGNEPVIWLDGLDIPLVNSFDSSFAEHYPENAGALLPVENGSSCPFSYPYTRSREELDRLFRTGPPDPCHGVKMQFANSIAEGRTLPTIGAFMQFLPAGFRGKPYRGTDATVYCVVEGSGQSQIGGKSVAWRKHDVFIVPSWHPVSHDSDSDAVLFGFSDQPAQKALGLWREEVPMI
jgi:gentisate 1,2-dioxygenase